jgi:hypothetical protein
MLLALEFFSCDKSIVAAKSPKLMEPGRNFPLRKGTLLTCISWRNAIANPQLNLYFTSPAEALVSMFREAVVTPFELTVGQSDAVAQNLNTNGDLYLNTFYLTEDIIINPMPDSRLARELAEDPTLNEVRAAIQTDCSSVPDKMGYVVPYQATIFYPGRPLDSPIPGRRGPLPGAATIRPRMTAYIVCRPNILLHAQSFRISGFLLINVIIRLIANWNDENPNSKISGGVIIDLLAKRLKEHAQDDIMRGPDLLEPIFVQPEVPGLVTSPIQYDPPIISSPTTNLSPKISPIAMLPVSAEEEFVRSPIFPITPEPARRPVVPPSSMLNPADPSTFVPQLMSPGGTTTLDAFASVPSDVVRVIALGMTLDAIAKTCLTSKRFNELICNNEDFWRLRLQQDYGKQFSRDKDEQVNEAAKRKLAGWTWKRYYAELSGNVPAAQALDFANQLAELPDVAEQVRRLPRDQYQQRVNEMRQQAGLGPVNFGPALQITQEGLNAFNRVGGEADQLDGFAHIRRARAGDEAAVFNQPEGRPVPQRRLQPRQLFRVQPMVGEVLLPVVEENPELDAQVLAPGQLLGRGGILNQDRRRPFVAGFNMDFDGDELPLQPPRPPNIQRAVVAELPRPLDQLRADLYQELLIGIRQANDLVTRQLLRELFWQQGLQNHGIDIAIDTFERDIVRLRENLNPPWSDEDEAIVRQVVEDYVVDTIADQQAVVINRQQGVPRIPDDVQRLFRQYSRLLKAIRHRDERGIRRFINTIYAGRGRDPMTNNIAADMDLFLNQYPNLLNRWPRGSIDRIREVLLMRFPEARQQPIRAEPAIQARERPNNRRGYFEWLAGAFGDILSYDPKIRRRTIARIVQDAGLPDEQAVEVFDILMNTIRQDAPDLLQNLTQARIANLRNSFAEYARYKIQGIRREVVEDYGQLARAVEQGDQEAIQAVINGIYRDVARRNPHRTVMDQVIAELDELNQHPEITRDWHPFAMQQIRDAILQYPPPEGIPNNNQRVDREVRLEEMDPRPPQPPPPAIDALNPPQNVIDAYNTFAILADHARNRDPGEYARLKQQFFDRIIAQVGGQRGAPAIELFQAIIDEISQYPRYRANLRNYARLLFNEFQQYVNQPVEGDMNRIEDGMNRVLIEEARQYLPRFQALIRDANRYDNLNWDAFLFTQLHNAFGQVYTEAGENQQDPVETLVLILQRLDQLPEWNRDNDPTVMRIFQQIYLPLVRGLGELITLFREVIDNRNRQIEEQLRNRALAEIQRFFVQYQWPADRPLRRINVLLQGFTELHHLSGRDLWRPNRDARLLEQTLQPQ